MSGSERREFFRINDTVVIQYEVIHKEHVDEVVSSIISPTENDLSQESFQLRVLQNNLNHLIEQIKQSDREVARALRILDDKLNLISQTIQRRNNPVNLDDVIKANVSGGGISFMVDEPIQPKETVNIYIQLLPSGTTINALSSVVSCDKLSDPEDDRYPYKLRLAFTHMDEHDRNILVKHTLNRQAEELRLGRESDGMSIREI